MIDRMQILVDADACPQAVQAILLRAAQRRRVPLVMVACRFVPVPDSEFLSSIPVAAGPDAADDRIVELVSPGDLVVTADIPLADRVVEAGGFALDPRGQMLTEANVKERLAMRDLMDDLRNSGMVTGGPAGYGAKAAQAFANQLDRFLTQRLGGA
jgi:uncharacterized protein YaiI (UPF0178 family)